MGDMTQNPVVQLGTALFAAGRNPASRRFSASYAAPPFGANRRQPPQPVERGPQR